MGKSVVIVLGATSKETGEATDCMIRRTLSGCDYAGQGDVLFCGGRTNPNHQRSEAEIMADVARKSGVLPSAIYREEKSINTMENALYAKEIIERYGWDDITVVTDKFHLVRARLVFKAIGIRATYKAAHMPPRPKISQIISFLYEVPALLWYSVRILKGHHIKKSK